MSESKLPPPATRHANRFTRLLRGRFALLFVFLLASITLYPYAEISGPGFYLFRAVGAAVILLTVYAVTFSRGLFLVVLTLAIPSLLQHVLLHPHATGVVPLLSRCLSLAFDLLIIAVIFRHVFATEKPDSETLFGALCVYLLLGFAFASCYDAIAKYQPKAFYLSPATNVHAVPDRFDFIYFSFGTLTESGTSGMTAVLPAARSLSLLEAITGILYLAVLISRLLSAYRAVEAAER